MAVAYNPTPINWAQLNNIGANLGAGYQRRALANELKDVMGPDGAIKDWNKAISIITMRNPIAGVELANRRAEAEALAGYRRDSLDQKSEPSLEERLLAPYLNPQPSYVGPPEDTSEAAVAAEEAEANSPAGVPGTSYTRPSGLENAPKLVQDKLMSTRALEREKQIGEGEGNRASFRAALQEVGPEVDVLIGQLTDLTRTADDGTFRNALGAWQGTPDPDDWRESLTRGAAQTFGGITNYLEKGAEHGFIKPGGDIKQPSELPGGYTTTLRSQVLATQAALVNVMQRLLRVPGIGAQSDAELKQIILQSGELSKAETKEEFYARLAGLMGRLKSLGFKVKIPSLEQVAGTKTSDQLTPEATAPAAPASMAPGVNENTVVGGENIGRTTNQPPTPPKRALNALKAYQNNPEARAAFDEIYGPGAAEFYLQKYR